MIEEMLTRYSVSQWIRRIVYKRLDVSRLTSNDYAIQSTGFLLWGTIFRGVHVHFIPTHCTLLGGKSQLDINILTGVSVTYSFTVHVSPSVFFCKSRPTCLSAGPSFLIHTERGPFSTIPGGVLTIPRHFLSPLVLILCSSCGIIPGQTLPRMT